MNCLANDNSQLETIIDMLSQEKEKYKLEAELLAKEVDLLRQKTK
jgi:hypothetical protein